MLTKQRRRRHRSPAPEGPAGSAPDPALPVRPQEPQPFLWLVMLVPAVGILTCGSKEPWALGALAALIGLCFLLAPPRLRVSRWVTMPIGTVVVLCLTAFLPASWFPEQPWRISLHQDFGIVMAGTRSPQPWVTLESLLLLMVGACWMVYCLGRGFTHGERRRMIQFLSVFISLLAVVAIAFRHWQVEVPFWRAIWNTAYLGPFPNRNNFSGLLAVGAVLTFAATHDAFRNKNAVWMLFAATFVPVFAGVLLNTSRMGVLALFAGLAAWIATASLQTRSFARLALSTAILLTLTALFLLFGGGISKRFMGTDGNVLATLAGDSRWSTFGDTLQMIAASPLLGVGLGNFEPAFALIRKSESLYSRALHPENDWLWFAAEAGLPCMISALVLFLSLAAGFGPWRGRDDANRRERRLRTAAGIAVILIGAEGLGDTPMHAPGFFVLGAVLVGLAVRPDRQEPASGAMPPWLHGCAGIFCAGVGTMWLFTASGRPLIPGNFVVRRLAREAAELVARGDDAAALEKWNEVAGIKPLQWDVYAERAMLKLRLGRSSPEALEDFARTRFLERQSAILCLHELSYWMRYDPPFGIPALREAMRRDPSRAAEFYGGSFGHLTNHPELRPAFRALAAGDPKLRLAYLSSTSGEEFKTELKALLDADPDLEAYTAMERLQLFRVWHARGDAAELVKALESNPSWREDGWTVLAAQRAKDGSFRAAFELAMSYISIPAESGARRKGSLAELNRVFLYNPTDISRGLDLYDAQRTQGLYDAALATLDQLSGLPHAPAKVLYERAVMFSRKGDYAKAWDAVQAYMKRIEKP